MINKDKHKCYACGKEFTWLVEIYNGYEEGRERWYDKEKKDAVLGQCAALDLGIFEIDVKCPYCQNINRFKKAINLAALEYGEFLKIDIK